MARPVRTALVRAVLPLDGALSDEIQVDIDAFWPRFDAAAPAHLRVGLAAATFLLGVLLPVVLLVGGAVHRLTPDRREVLLRRAARLPGAGALLDIVKVVACFAWFSDPRVGDSADNGQYGNSGRKGWGHGPARGRERALRSAGDSRRS